MQILLGFAALALAAAEESWEMMQEQVITSLQSEDSVERFMAALDEGDEELELDSAASLAQDAAEWGAPTQNYGHQGSSYGNPYGGGSPYGGNPYGGNPYGSYGNPYGNNPYSNNPYGGFNGVPGVCSTKIAGSSCMVFGCSKSRGPTTCNTADYTCYCQAGHCATGNGCIKSCETKIESSSCMVFNCASSRGPTTCNRKDYSCECQPGYCARGGTCVAR
ncbi:unnamed protein product [Effrenium voratum]|nr:unnamed protein product [Effrenium voratum]